MTDDKSDNRNLLDDDAFNAVVPEDWRSLENWRDSYTPAEVAAAAEFGNAIIDHAQKNKGNFPLGIKSRLRAYFRQPEVKMRSILSEEIATDITNIAKASYGEDHNGDYPDLAQRAFFYYGATAFMIEQAKELISPKTLANKHGSGLNTELAGRLGWSLDSPSDAELAKLKKVNGAMLVPSDSWFDWINVRQRQLIGAIESKKRITDYFDFQPELPDSESLKGANDELAQSIQFLQKYLPKQCIAPSLSGQLTKEWLVSPPFEAWAENKFHPCHGFKMGIFGSNRPIETSRRDTAKFEDAGTLIQVTFLPGIFETTLTISAMVGPDYELYSYTGQKLLDYLPDHYRGKYEQLRSEILCIYHDSVVPVYVTELADQEVAIQESGHNVVGHPEDKVTKLRRLVLARKLVDDTLRAEIVYELDNPDRDVVHKAMARHEVIGHVRRLPKHFRASQVARDQCMQDMGVVLAEYGETYVRTHERGKLENKSRGHKASFVAGRVALVRDGNQSS